MTPLDYESIKQLTSDIYEDYDLNNLPIDIFNLVTRMGFKLAFASNLMKNKIKNGKIIDKYLFCTLPDGFSFKYDEKETYVIFVNDIKCKKEAQRFTCAHELGHILLGHKGFYHKTEEDQANYFAHYLLSPTSLAIIPEFYDKFINNLECIQYVFGISYSQSEIANRYYFNRKRISEDITYSYETVINSHLYNSVIKRIDKWSWYKKTTTITSCGSRITVIILTQKYYNPNPCLNASETLKKGGLLWTQIFYWISCVFLI